MGNRRLENPAASTTEEVLEVAHEAGKNRIIHGATKPIIEGRDGHFGFDMADRHNKSFIQEVIPAIQSRKALGEITKVLTIGGNGGTCAYADQIRSAYKGEVEVHNAGLSQQDIEISRKDNHIKGTIHPDDYKWTDVRAVNPTLRYDCIIEDSGAFGEHGHMTNEALILEDLRHKVGLLAPGGIYDFALISPKGSKDDPKLTYKPILEKLQREIGVTWQLLPAKEMKNPLIKLMNHYYLLTIQKPLKTIDTSE